jgi:hypothetical protein
MRKSTIFISAVLTTFALVMLYSVAAAARGIVSSGPSTQTEVAVVEPTQTLAPVSTDVTPEQAAQLASQVTGRTDLFSAESSTFNSVDAYKVTFISGDVVYVSLNGQILSIQTVPQVITVQVQPSNNNARNQNNTSSNSSEHSDNHEEPEDH